MNMKLKTEAPPEPPRLDPVYSRNEIAQALGISLANLDLMHQRGEAPPRFRISPRRWGYPETLYREWQRKRLREAQEEPEQ
jgi:predicted DNA-binding transcriptional regulator AlpA